MVLDDLKRLGDFFPLQPCPLPSPLTCITGFCLGKILQKMVEEGEGGVSNSIGPWTLKTSTLPHHISL
jgi:hypothetical protein